MMDLVLTHGQWLGVKPAAVCNYMGGISVQQVEDLGWTVDGMPALRAASPQFNVSMETTSNTAVKAPTAMSTSITAEDLSHCSHSADNSVPTKQPPKVLPSSSPSPSFSSSSSPSSLSDGCSSTEAELKLPVPSHSIVRFGGGGNTPWGTTTMTHTSHIPMFIITGTQDENRGPCYRAWMACHRLGYKRVWFEDIKDVEHEVQSSSTERIWAFFQQFNSITMG